MSVAAGVKRIVLENRNTRCYMMRMSLCPLERYFRKSDESKLAFARRTGISRDALWTLLAGEGNQTIGLLVKIEEATGRKVTAAELARWLVHKRRREGRGAAD